MNKFSTSLLIAAVIFALASIFIPSPASATESEATAKDLVSTNCEGVRELATSVLGLRYGGSTLIQAYGICDHGDEPGSFGAALQEQCETVVLTAYSLDPVSRHYRQLQSEVLANTLFDMCVEVWVEGLSTE